MVFQLAAPLALAAMRYAPRAAMSMSPYMAEKAYNVFSSPSASRSDPTFQNNLGAFHQDQFGPGPATPPPSAPSYHSRAGKMPVAPPVPPPALAAPPQPQGPTMPVEDGAFPTTPAAAPPTVPTGGDVPMPRARPDPVDPYKGTQGVDNGPENTNLPDSRQMYGGVSMPVYGQAQPSAFAQNGMQQTDPLTGLPLAASAPMTGPQLIQKYMSFLHGKKLGS